MNNHRSKNYHNLVVLELTSRITNHLIFEWHCQTILRKYFHVIVPFKSFVETGNGRVFLARFLLCCEHAVMVSGPAEKSFKSVFFYKTANANLWTSQNIRINKTTEIWYFVSPRRSFPISTITVYTYRYSHNVIVAHFTLLQMGDNIRSQYSWLSIYFLTFIILIINTRSLGLTQARHSKN